MQPRITKAANEDLAFRDSSYLCPEEHLDHLALAHILQLPFCCIISRLVFTLHAKFALELTCNFRIVVSASEIFPKKVNVINSASVEIVSWKEATREDTFIVY